MKTRYFVATRSILSCGILVVLTAGGCKKQEVAVPAARQMSGTNLSAEKFVRDLYAHYGAGKNFSPLFAPDRDRYFSAYILELQKEDAERTPKGDVGAVDFDPICGCQDDDGLTLTDLSITPVKAGTAVANVILKSGDDTTNLQLKLIETAAGWRVDDVRIYFDANHSVGLQNMYETYQMRKPNRPTPAEPGSGRGRGHVRDT